MRNLLLLLFFLFIGCSQKSEITKGLSAIEIHSKFYKAIQNNDLDKADNIFMDLEAEYPGSFYIKNELLILFFAHLQNGDYELSKFYINEYEKRFASSKEIPWCEYQKIKIDFLSYQNAYTNQAKILNIINECKIFKLKYSNSTFIYEVNTIYIKALLTNLYLNDKIYKLYEKEGKIKAAKKFKVKIPKSIPPYVRWYKKIFYW